MFVAPARFGDPGAFRFLKAVLLSLALHAAVSFLAYPTAIRSGTDSLNNGRPGHSMRGDFLPAKLKEQRAAKESLGKIPEVAESNKLFRRIQVPGRQRRSKKELSPDVVPGYRAQHGGAVSANTPQPGSGDDLVRYRLSLARALRKETRDSKFETNSEYHAEIEITKNALGARQELQIKGGDDEEREKLKELIAKVLLDVSVPTSLLVGHRYTLEFKLDGN